MKQDSIQQLLAKRQAGTLTDSELEELNRLTHKDEVVAAAEQAATVIVRRRRLVTSSVALVAVAVAVFGITLLVPKNEMPLVAQQQPAPQPVVEDMPQSVEAPATPAVPTTPAASKHTTAPKPAVAQAQPAKSVPQAAETHRTDPTVMCNNQCEADSVINDIWKFLTA